MTAETSDPYHLFAQQLAQEQIRKAEKERSKTDPTKLVYQSLAFYLKSVIEAGNAQLTIKSETFKVNLILNVTSFARNWQILVFKEYKNIVDTLYKLLAQYNGNRNNLRCFLKENGIIFVEASTHEVGIFADVIKQMLAYQDLHDDEPTREEFLASLGIVVPRLHKIYWNNEQHRDLYNFLAGGDLPERPRRYNEQPNRRERRPSKQNRGDSYLDEVGRRGSGVYLVKYR